MDISKLQDIDINIFGKEEDTMKWFDNYLKTRNGSFANSVNLFQKYYYKCFQDLINLQYDKDSKKIEYQFLGNDSKDYLCNYINRQDIDQCLNNRYHLQILRILKNNSYLRDTCLEWNLISKENMKKIMNLSDNEIGNMSLEELYSLFYDVKKDKISEDEIVELILPLLKMHRLNNMQIKYAHTARVVYLTDYELSNMNNLSPLIQNIVLTSALFHDVGRFYQGAFYNSFDDSQMKNMEGRGRGHAEAGYYYSLLNMINLNTLGVNSSDDLITHGIAALVVSRHQASNQDNLSFDQVMVSKDFSDKVDSKLLNFIFDAYLNARPFQDGIHARFGKNIPHQQKYMKNSLDNILRTIRIVTEQYISDSSKIEEILKNTKDFLGERISEFLVEKNISKDGYYNEEEEMILTRIVDNSIINKYLENGKIKVNEELSNYLEEYYTYQKSSSIFFLTEEEEKILEKFHFSKEEKERLFIRKKPKYGDRELIVRTPELNFIINEYREYTFCKSQNLDFSHYSRIFSVAKNDLAKFAQFDIAKSIRDMFEGKSNIKDIDPEVKSIVDLSLNIVMDADKLDIFVQRANKRWDNWNPSYITVRSDSNKHQSFLDVIQNVYEIPLEYNDDGVVLNERLKKIIMDNYCTNTAFRKSIDRVIDIRKDDYSSSELEGLRTLLNEDYVLLTKSSKIHENSLGKMIFDHDLINYLLNICEKNPILKEDLIRNNIVIDFSLENKEIPAIVLSLLEKNNIHLEEIDNRIKVSYDTMREVFPDQEVRIEKERELLLPKDLRDKMFLLDKDREKIGNSKFPLGRRASKNPNFDWANIFPAIWWHIDQFILTNMRSNGSFKFINETHLLDRLKDAYSSDECNKDFIYFIDEIIDYAKEFIDTVSTLYVDSSNNIGFSSELRDDQKRVSMLDDSLMIKVRDETCRKWNEKKKKNEILGMIPTDLEEVEERISVL